MHDKIPMPIYLICPTGIVGGVLIAQLLFPVATEIHEKCKALLTLAVRSNMLRTNNKYIARKLKSLQPATANAGFNGYLFLNFHGQQKLGFMLQLSTTRLLPFCRFSCAIYCYNESLKNRDNLLDISSRLYNIRYTQCF